MYAFIYIPYANYICIHITENVYVCVCMYVYIYSICIYIYMQ